MNLQRGLLSILLLLSGCSDKPAIVKHTEAYSGAGHHAVYVVSHGWHTGLIISANTIYESIPALRRRFGETPYIEFGWGDRGFYQAEEITVGLTLQAVLWPTETVVHAVAVPENVEGYFSQSEVAAICLTDKELSSLAEFISNSFFRNEAGEVDALEKGIYGDSQFYKGMGDYHLANTCNKWTAKGLKSVGMDIWPSFKLSAESVMGYLADSGVTAPAKSGGLLRCPVVVDVED